MYRYSYLSVLLVLLQSCSSLNSNRVSIVEESGISYLYVDSVDQCAYSRITLFQDGMFIYKETNHYILGRHCQCNKGKWTKEGDTINLTTLFQDNNNVYITELGNIELNDSISLLIYSLSTMEPSTEFAYIDNKKNVISPNIKGELCIPCSEKENLVRQLLIGLSGSNDELTLECGRRYKYYIKDCMPTILQKERFILTDSTLFNIENKRIYFRE